MTKEEFEKIIESELYRLDLEKKKLKGLEYYYKLNEDSDNLKEIKFQLNLVNKKIEKLNEIIEYHAYARYKYASAEELHQYKNNKINKLNETLNYKIKELEDFQKQQEDKRQREQQESIDRKNELIVERDAIILWPNISEKDDDRLREIYKELQEIEKNINSSDVQNDEFIIQLQQEIENIMKEINGLKNFSTEEIRQQLLSTVKSSNRIQTNKNNKIYEEIAEDPEKRVSFIEEENERNKKLIRHQELVKEINREYSITEKVVDNPLVHLPFSHSMIEIYKEYVEKQNHSQYKEEKITLSDLKYLLAYMQKLLENLEKIKKSAEQLKAEYEKKDINKCIDIMRIINPKILEKLAEIKSERDKIANSALYNFSSKKQVRVMELDSEIRSIEKYIRFGHDIEKYYYIKINQMILENHSLLGVVVSNKELIKRINLADDDPFINKENNTIVIGNLTAGIDDLKATISIIKDIIAKETEKVYDYENDFYNKKNAAEKELQEMDYNPTKEDFENNGEITTEETIIDKASDHYISTLQDKIDEEAKKQAELEQLRIKSKEIKNMFFNEDIDTNSDNNKHTM